MTKFFEETNDKNQEAIFGALSSFLRAENYSGKRLFINEKGGLQFLIAILKRPNLTIRLKKKVLFLLNDILNTDDLIFPEGKKGEVASLLAYNNDFTDHLIDMLVEASIDIENGQMWDLRENLLSVLRDLIKQNDEIRLKHSQILKLHKLKLAQGLQKCEHDVQSLYMKEIKQVNECENEQSDHNP
jgi:hypothetical protein